MKDKKKKRDYTKAVLIAKVSLFWVVLAGIVVLVQAVDKNAEQRGQLQGYTKAATTIQSLCK